MRLSIKDMSHKLETVDHTIRVQYTHDQESMRPSGYLRVRRCNVCFTYISLASLLDHCTQGATGDSGDRLTP